MAVVAIVGDASEAARVVTWSGRFAAARNSELIIFYVGASLRVENAAISAEGAEQLADPVLEAVHKAIEKIVRTRRARTGRIPRYAVSVRRIDDPGQVTKTISRIRAEDPILLVGADAVPEGKTNGKTLTQLIAARIPCETVMLYGDDSRSLKSAHLLAGSSEGRHDRPMVGLAAAAAAVVKGSATVTYVEASAGEELVEVGKRGLRGVLRDIGLEESQRLELKVVSGEDRVKALADEAEGHDLVLIGADRQADVAELLESTTKPLFGVFRRAPQFAFGRKATDQMTWLPRLNPADFVDLYEKLQSGSRWNVDFVVMLGLAAAIASLGLLQSSPAVVIGSMLLAPLMTPMIGMGLALNQGNAKLAHACSRSIGRGFLAALVISFLVGVITPGNDLTPELLSRTEPNILDLLIALFSGMAAAYALARPSLAGTIAGVAIATALVPPLCAAGISLAYDEMPAAFGATSLLAANVLSIILAAALTFRAMGLRGFADRGPRGLWVRRVVVGLTTCAVVISVPLALALVNHVHRGRAAPIALSVTNETRDAILTRVQAEPGVTVLLIGRPGIPREKDPVDVGIVISSDHPLRQSFRDELVKIAREKMQDPELRVWVECVAEGWARPDDGISR